MKSQTIDGTRVSAEIRRSIHRQLLEMNHGVREVARRHGVRDTSAVQIAFAVEREQAALRAENAFREGRRSLLTRLGGKAA